MSFIQLKMVGNKRSRTSTALRPHGEDRPPCHVCHSVMCPLKSIPDFTRSLCPIVGRSNIGLSNRESHHCFFFSYSSADKADAANNANSIATHNATTTPLVVLDIIEVTSAVMDG